MAAARGWLRRAIPALLVCAGALAITAPAAHAGSAKLVKYRATQNDPAKQDFTFFDKGGLQLVGDCVDDGPDSDLTVGARTTTADSTIHWRAMRGPASGLYAYSEDDDFDPGTTGQEADILDGLGTDFDQDSSGLIVYARPGGVNVSVKFAAIEDTGFAATKDCAFVGIARVLDSTSSSRVNFRADDGQSSTFDTSGVHFDAECGVTFADTLSVLAKSEVPNSVVGFDGHVPAGGFIWGPPDEGFNPGETYGAASDNAIGQYAFAGGSGGANVTLDALYEDGSVTPDTPFGGTKDCAWVGTARTRLSGDAKRVNLRKEEGTALTTFFEKGGLKLKGSCATGGDLDIFARSKFDNAVIAANRTFSSGMRHNSDADFDNTSLDEYDLLLELALDNDDDATGQIVYSQPDGSVLTIGWMVLQGTDEPFGGTRDCAFVGTAEQKSA